MTLRLEISTGGTATTNVAGAIRRDLPVGGPKFVAKAEEGSVGGSEVYVDDPTGALDIVGLRRWWAWESAEDAGSQVIATGYIGPREIGRIANNVDDHVVGADRCWSVTLNDHNQLLSRRLVTGADGDRPAETDIARITWLLGSGYLASVDDVLGYLNTADPVDMDAADLRGQSAYEVLRDAASRAGKDFFLIRHGDTSPPSFGGTDAYSLFYDYSYSTTYASTIRLTNLPADVDNATTFAIHPDARLRRTPDRTYSGVYVRHINGAYYAQNTTTANTYGARDTATTDSNITTDAAAATLATTYLDNGRTEEDRITCRFVVPSTKVNHLREGQAVQIKASHFGAPYSTTYMWTRCVSRSVEQLSDTFYELTVELAALGGGGTYSEAYLTDPYETNLAGGFFLIDWRRDGDDVRPGRSSQPLTGLMEYVGPARNRSYLRMLGSGVVSINVQINCAIGGTLPAGTNSMRVTRNGEEIGRADDPISYTGVLGPNDVSSTWDYDLTNIAVRYGDEIGVEIQFDPAWYAANPGLANVPIGVGFIDHQLYVGGYLR